MTSPTGNMFEPMHAVSRLASTIRVLLLIWMVVAVLELVQSVASLSLIVAARRGGGLPDIAGPLLVGGTVASLGYAGLYLAAAITSVIWLFRARDNAQLRQPELPHQRARAWVLWSWAVPVVNLWFPKQVVDDIWQSSDPAMPDARRGRRALAKPRLCYLWWGLYVSSIVAEALARFVRETSGPTIGTVYTTAVLGVLASVLLLAAAPAWAKIVDRITTMQRTASASVVRQR